MTAAIFAEVSTPVFVPEMKAYRIATRQARTVVRLRDGEPLVKSFLHNDSFADCGLFA